MKQKKQKLTLSKQSVSKLTEANSQKIYGGVTGTTFTATINSILQNTCTCSFFPKCTSDNLL